MPLPLITFQLTQPDSQCLHSGPQDPMRCSAQISSLASFPAVRMRGTVASLAFFQPASHHLPVTICLRVRTTALPFAKKHSHPRIYLGCALNSSSSLFLSHLLRKTSPPSMSASSTSASYFQFPSIFPIPLPSSSFLHFFNIFFLASLMSPY